VQSLASPFNPQFPNLGEPALHWRGLYGSAGGLTIAQAATHDNPLVIVVTRDNRRLQLLHSELQFYRSGRNAPPLARLLDWECLPYDLFPPHQDITSERLRTLANLPTMCHGLLLVTMETLMQRLPPVMHIIGQTFFLACGDTLDIETFRAQLQHSGYFAVTQVMGPGEYAVRGGVIDLFTMGFERPFRLDLFGSEIESIRYFDPETQRSSEKVERIDILPAREFPLTKEGIRRFRENFRATFEGDPQLHLVYREISRGNTPAGMDFYFPLFFSETATLFDYVPLNAHWIIDEEAELQANTLWAAIQDRYQIASHDSERRPLKPDRLYLNPMLLSENLGRQRRALIQINPTHERTIVFSSQLPDEFPVQANSTEPYSALISHLKNRQHRILLVAETPGRRQALDDLLTHHAIKTTNAINWNQWVETGKSSLALTIGELERGMLLPTENIEVITESQLYGDRVQQRRRRTRQTVDPESVIRSLAELSVGDPVVHEEQGVGRYRGLQTLGIAGEETEFLVLEYQDGDRLYVPILTLHLVSRYVGGDAESAPLHKLGTDAWDKAKKRARDKVHDVAVELLEMNALRAARKGYCFKVPHEEYEAFVERFSFEDTPDQERVMSEVLTDLSSKHPMDRLVCGDVGFGKTEIALRAAFIAVHNHKQVALLVPTTILAQQHFQTFRDRFADLPIQVELLSRFRQRKDMEAVLESLPNGYPDIVIGTHRLLQKDVLFRDLGLLIIDEEHRFGVRQKETLKKIRREVDILTLTATPIPRTLNLGLAGLRSISLIATPPPDRRSIKTFVCPWNDNLAREACLREIRRGGQVFFLHNEVRTIDVAAERLARLVPEADIRIAHGQMPKRELERVMRDFYHRRFQILACTTIIESGIDLPNANTIVVTRADLFGLAQLHQLRGRVGRSNHQAYAYLMTPPGKTLHEDAEKRLDAITKLEELGAGFMLASHDLEIRGAGELLGEEQSGTVDEIGFSLYSEYLGRAIQDISGRFGAGQSNIKPGYRKPVELQFNIPALFPDTYLPDVHARLVVYKRIAGAGSAEELHALQLEAIDRFGPPPEAAKSLFRISKLQLDSQAIGIRRFTLDQNGGRIEFDPDPAIDPSQLIQLIRDEPGVFRMAGGHSVQIQKPLEEHPARLNFAEELLARLAIE
jgi:transcription-repair coupling factor (superfamily II helicase)